MNATAFSFSSVLATYTNVLFLASGLTILSCAYLVLNRLYLSPVAKIPGPKLAALSFWYEYYYDVWSTGQYTFKLKELHKKYGPIIRINPYEVHIDDPEFYDKVYVGAATRQTDKWWWSANMFTVEKSTLSTIPHALHHRRRMMFSKHFSTAAVYRLESVIRDKVDKLLQRLDHAGQTKKPVPLSYAYSALTMDIIETYCFAKCRNIIDRVDFAKEYHDMFNRTSLDAHFTKQFPWVIALFKKIPLSIVTKLVPDLALTVGMLRNFIGQVQEVIDEREHLQHGSKTKTDVAGLDAEKTIFNSMLDADVPSSEKDIVRLAEEAQLLVIAGTVTTAHALTTITYHLLDQPKLLARLKEEIAKAEKDVSSTNSALGAYRSPIPLKTMEALPFLHAVILEGLRMGYGVPHRLQRVSPDTTLNYHGFTLPPGTPVSMSAMLMHDNESLFPAHERFNPDRWLPLDTEGARLNKYLVPFSKGSRQCVGMNLAWAELHLTLAAMFGSRGKNLRLYDTTFERDIKTIIDGFNPLSTLGSEGLKVTVDEDK